MNFQFILNEINRADPEFGERVSPRRRAIKNFTRAVSLTALPFALGGLFKKAYGKTNDAITDTLNLVLRLEFLESNFYADGLNKAGLITASQDRSEIGLIRDNEVAHYNFVRQTIQSLGGAPVTLTPANLDYTGGAGSQAGPFADVLNNYVTYLAVSQTFENTGVRGLKGSASVFMGNNELLTAALGFHSAEGRHAAHVQMMRRRNGHATGMKPWITNADSGIPGAAGDAAQPTYVREENTTQGGQNIVGIGGKAISQEAASEAFDEPLTADEVKAIAAKFVTV